MMVLSSLATCNYGNHNPELSLSASEYEHVSDPRVKKSKHFFLLNLYIYLYHTKQCHILLNKDNN